MVDKGKTYIYSAGPPLPDRILFVGTGLGDCWIVCYTNPKGRKRRFKSKYLPPVPSRDECQKNLDDYAQKLELKEVGGPNDL